MEKYSTRMGKNGNIVKQKYEKLKKVYLNNENIN